MADSRLTQRFTGTWLTVLAAGILTFLAALLTFSLDHDHSTWPWITGLTVLAVGVTTSLANKRRGSTVKRP